MVTVKVDTELIPFEVPKALICGHSAYFEKAFGERFKEGQEKVLELVDVRHQPFGVFVGWLYTQRIYWDGPVDGAPVDEKAESVRESVGGSVGDEEAQSARERVGGASNPPSAEGDARETDEGTEQKLEKNEQSLSVSDADDEQTQDKELDKDHLPDEDNPDDPVTWTWDQLLELYVFADKYYTRRFRNAVIEVIQIKALQRHPRLYQFPSTTDSDYAFDNLPRTSTLYAFLLDLMTYDLLPGGEDSHADLPSHVLAASWFRAKQVMAWQACKKCARRREARYCDSSSGCPGCAERRKEDQCHAAHAELEDARAPYGRDVCLYHEHETEEEGRLCGKRWELIREERDI